MVRRIQGVEPVHRRFWLGKQSNPAAETIRGSVCLSKSLLMFLFEGDFILASKSTSGSSFDQLVFFSTTNCYSRADFMFAAVQKWLGLPDDTAKLKHSFSKPTESWVYAVITADIVAALGGYHPDRINEITTRATPGKQYENIAYCLGPKYDYSKDPPKQISVSPSSRVRLLCDFDLDPTII